MDRETLIKSLKCLRKSTLRNTYPKPKRIFHVNLLKKWERQEEEALYCNQAENDVLMLEWKMKQELQDATYGKQLHEAQLLQVKDLMGEFPTVIGVTPTKTNLVQHRIIILQAVTVLSGSDLIEYHRQ